MTLTHAGPSGVTSHPGFASPVDLDRYGPYRITRKEEDTRPLYRFANRLVSPRAAADDGARAFITQPHRYHLYGGWFCPWAHRSTMVIAMAGLEDVVSVSYVDNDRDGRGWAFRETHGPDPVNGFTLLRDAYEITEPGFDGHVSVPTLWDRHIGRIVSNDYGTLDADLATEFLDWSSTAIDLYPAELRPNIDALDRWLKPAVNHGVRIAAGAGTEAVKARQLLLATFNDLERTLGTYRYLLGARITLADIRLWVTLVRYDVQANARGEIGPPLSAYPALWAYARDIYQRPAGRATTDFASFSRPGAGVPDWEEPAQR